MPHRESNADRRSAEGPIHALLSLCARPRFPAELLPALVSRAARVTAWDEAVLAAERHGLGPLMFRHLQTGRVPLETGIARQLQGLYLRHRAANAVQLRALGEILDALRSSGIEARVLKGPALISLVYGDPALRPTSDLDVLVPKREALRAHRVLHEIGFRGPGGASPPRIGSHHHLPPAMREMEGVIVHVELHHDALVRDYTASLELDEHREPPMPFDVCGREALTLGRHEALWHLCQHLVGPLPGPLRLVWIADVRGYTETFGDQLDWELVARRYPVVLNVLALLHELSPLPQAVSRHLPAQIGEALQGAGDDSRMWSWSPASMRTGGRWRQLHRVLTPPRWWLILRYGGGSLRPWVGRLRHLVVVARAVRRRMRTA